MKQLTSLTRYASSVVLTCAALAVTLAGCSTDTTQDTSGIGSVDMTVTLATPPAGPNEQIDAVEVSFWCEGTDPVLGVPRPPQSNPETFTINTATSQGPEPYNTIGLFEKQGIPAGPCHFFYTAVSNTGNTECTGEASPVMVMTNQTTSFEVVLACIHTPRYGGVRSDGTFNQCAEYRQVLVSPTTQAIGNLVDVATEVYDPDGDDVTVSVQGVGACSNVQYTNGQTAASCETVSGCDAVLSTVECTDVGLCQIIVAVSDDGFSSCTGLLPDGSNNDAARQTINVDCNAAQGLCAGVTCPDAGECVTNFCDPDDGVCKPRNDGINTGCDFGGGPGTGVCDGQGVCVECNMDSQCGAGETCVNNACELSIVCEYEQDFEALDPADPDALRNDGWRYFGNVFAGDGSLKFGFGPFPTPTTSGQISAIATGEGGPEQGANQLTVFSNYDCCVQTLEGHFNGTDLVQTIVFQSINPILATDIGRTFTFTFDAKRGNIGGNTTARAYIQTLDPDAGFAVTSQVELDTTNLPVEWATYSLTLDVSDPLLEGQILDFGFVTVASNFEPAGNFYDNISFCAPGGGGNPGIELRPLPDIYTTGSAINYGPYRGTGPGTGDVPSDADILEDLQLMQTAGFNLIRLFGGDTVSERILQLAEANFPDLKFQQGLFLEGLPPGPAQQNCDSGLNDSQVATAIQLANTYSNVVTVSVGNETSFFAAFMPLRCLEGYIREVRENVTQPVGADDDYTFFANFFGRSPDTILRVTDFVPIHMYPITNYRQWDWQQLGVPAGPLRAEAMMNAALAKAQQNYQAVVNYRYLDASGRSVTIGESRPIVITETGWKWRQTAPTQEIETYAANPVNAKWYYDLMRSWESSGGPLIMDFSAFDEAWKLTDDGWGFWDQARNPNYVLCDTPAGSPCNNPVYQGAGFFQ